MGKIVSLASVSGMVALAMVFLGSTAGMQAQTKQVDPGATRKPAPPRTVLLVDTDDACQLTVDDEAEGVITPDQSKKINVSLGDHIVKCFVENVPELMWRKVVEAKSSEQVAAMVALKALHIQYDQAVGNVQQQKEKEATAKEQAAAAEEERKTRLAEFPERLFEAIKGRWEYDKEEPLDPNSQYGLPHGYSWTVDFKSLNGLNIDAQLTLDRDNDTSFRQSVITASFKMSVPNSTLMQDGDCRCVQATEKLYGKNHQTQTIPCTVTFRGTQIRFLDSTHLELRFGGGALMVFEKKLGN